MRKVSYLTIFLLFLACYRITSPEYIGDTVRYVGDIVNRAQGRESQFWEFGHLLWRPWGFVGYSLSGALYAQWFGDTPAQAVARFLIQTNLICSAAALLLLLSLLRKVARAWIAGAVVFAMSCSVCFLNYSHSGAPYIPGLLFSALAFCWLTKAAGYPKGGRRYACLAGVSFAIACALWFPYSFIGLGMLLVPYLWLSPGSQPTAPEERPLRRQLVASFLLSLAVSALFLFAAGAAAKGIGNVSQLAKWIRESDNGWSQSRTAMRAVTGLPRSVWDLGGDTVLLKRWLFSDPYNPVRILALIFSLGGKIAAFYLGIGAALWVLWNENRALLFMLTAAILPLLLFAVALFEPSSPERFLPVFPFAYLAFAVVLDRAYRHVVAAACVVVLLAGTTVFNLVDNRSKSAGPRLTETRRRIQALNRNVRPGSLVFVLTFNDGLYTLPGLYPLDNSLAAMRFRVTDAIFIASRNTARWRPVFAGQTQKEWAQDREVWLSERLLAPRPQASWLWVEGDDRRIRWPDVPAAFRQLETDLKVEVGGDGFLRLAQSQANRDRLAREWAAERDPAH